MSVSQIEEQLKRSIALGIPPAVELASFAIKNNKPMSLAQPDSLAAQQFRKLAEMIKAHVDSV
jgi:MinD-like ATPase involved in chromosome partitioning or flagellar assembly